MPQTITTGYKELCEAAEREIETLPVAEAVKLAGRDDTVLVDIRDIRELQREGRVPGAFHCPRGMLEFWIDPNGSYFKPVFGQDKKFVFFCAGGMRSALAAQTAQRMGLKPVAHIRGGFGAWKAAGGPVVAPDAMPGEAKKSCRHRRNRLLAGIRKIHLRLRAPPRILFRAARWGDDAETDYRQQELLILVVAGVAGHDGGRHRL